jgi:hypothetical protein
MKFRCNFIDSIRNGSSYNQIVHYEIESHNTIIILGIVRCLSRISCTRKFRNLINFYHLFMLCASNSAQGPTLYSDNEPAIVTTLQRIDYYYYYYYYYYYGFTALCWALAAFPFLNPIHSWSTPWTGDQPVARPLPTRRTTHNTGIHALIGIRTHDPSVRASEDSSCLRPRGH